MGVADSQIDVEREVAIENGPEAVLVSARLRRRSLFTNLIDNAVKYGSKASVRLRQEGAEVIVELGDNGPGMPPAELERVFEPFYRGERSRSRSTGGTVQGGKARLENHAGGLRAASPCRSSR